MSAAWWPHLLRPQALWLLLALPLLVGLWWYRRRRAERWRGLVDAHLLPHLLAGRGRAPAWGVAGLALGYALAVLALAGPSWRQVAQPTWQTRAPLVVALDLSDRVLATDLPPSRLLQVRAKLASLLDERKGGQVALVVYAGDAFTVAPLTPDAENVALFLDALSPQILPVAGQRADLAIARSMELLQQAGFPRGQILLMTDQTDAAAREQAARAAAQGYPVSVLGVGSAAGATYRDGTGRFARAALDAAALRDLARQGGGRYAPLGQGIEDLQALGVLDPGQADAGSVDAQGRRGWEDQGYWLLPGLMLLALGLFRRGGGLVAMLALAVLLPSQPARAAGIDWWQRGDQQHQQAMAQGAQAYRAGQFGKAAALFGAQSGADAQYNLGNALARQGQYAQAIAAYDRALQLQPDMDDARANRAAVEAARKRQPPGQDAGDGQGQHAQDQDPSEDGQGKPRDGQQGDGRGQPRPRDGQASGDGPPPAGQDGREQDRPPPDSAGEPADQQAADQAQRQRMQQAMADQGQAEPKPPLPQGQAAAETPEEREQRQAVEAWLRRVPDDPGGLLRAKFEREYQRRQRGGQ